MEEFAQDERRGPAGPRVVTPGLDHDVRRYLLLFSQAEFVTDRAEEVIAQTDAFPGDHDPLGIEDDGDAGDRPADVASGAFEDPSDRRVTFRERGEVGRLGEAPGRGEDLPDERRLSGDGLEATPPTAPAFRPAGDDLDMADLAGAATASAMDEAVDDQAHADAATDRHDQEMGQAASRSE